MAGNVVRKRDTQKLRDEAEREKAARLRSLREAHDRRLAAFVKKTVGRRPGRPPESSKRLSDLLEEQEKHGGRR